MSELSNFNCQFSGDLNRLSSSIPSQLLYLSLLLFFSPYLLNLISFLPPLVISTFLLFLARFLSPNIRLERLQFKDEYFHLSDRLRMFETSSAVTQKQSAAALSESGCIVMEVKRSENSLKIVDVEEMKKKVEEPMGKSQSDRIVRCCSEEDGKLKVRSASCRSWERTLAWKMQEERRGCHGMDSLWEAYEMADFGRRNNKKMMKEQEEEDDDDECEGRKLCCLQALKLSAGKVVLKPNLVKISKAIKGFGWLHKKSKKVHNLNHAWR